MGGGKADESEFTEAKLRVAAVLDPLVSHVRGAPKLTGSDGAAELPTPRADPEQSRTAATEPIRLLSLYDLGAAESSSKRTRRF
jgi:hypothetical protein